MKIESNNIINKLFNKKRIKERLPFALLAGFTPSFMFFFFGVLEIFAGNRDQMKFTVGDFILPIFLIALASSVFIAALILFLPKSASTVVFGIFSWLSFMGYVQVLFDALCGTGSLSNDTGVGQSLHICIINAALWMVTGVVIIAGAFIMHKKEIIKRIFIIGLLIIFVMLAVGCVSQIGKMAGGTEPTKVKETAEITQTKALSESDTAKVSSGPDTSADPVIADIAEEANTGTAEISDTAAAAKTAKPAKRTDPSEKEPVISNDPADAYLTAVGIDKVSTGKNIVVFVLDRFDVSFYNDTVKKLPDFFDKLDGFTYFSDNVSLYSRTWPAVPTMITGIDHDFQSSPKEYFSKAYVESPFLKDLKKNDYTVKLYTQQYYCYRDGTPLVGVADNISYASEYVVSDRAALVGNLFALSAYRYLPNALKDILYVSTATFSNAVEPVFEKIVTEAEETGDEAYSAAVPPTDTGLITGVDPAAGSETDTPSEDETENVNAAKPLYKLDDPPVCRQILENGLSFDMEGDSFILIHLNGCHTPSNMDENANEILFERKDMAGALEQMRGCFKTIYFYLDEMKRLGVYDDATVVITGDHPRARDDKKIPEQPRLTALFVKPAGAKGELKYSKAQVSQENLIPTLVKSSGIKTDVDYGRTYFEIPENENTVRYHKFELSGTPNKIVVFEVTGDGNDFNNWKIVDSVEPSSGSFYK